MRGVGSTAAPEVPTLAGPRHTVVVIGNGPVGATTALLLARWGVPVELLDARPGRDPVGSKAICQQRDVLDVWCSIGGVAIAEEGVTWRRARTFYRDRELFCIDLVDPGRSPLPPFVNISQTRTEEVLDALVAAEPLITVRWGHEVHQIDQDQDAVQVVARTADGERSLTAAYAVACGGARGSQLRQALGVDFPGRSFDDAFLICDVQAGLPGWEQERRFFFDPVWNPGRQVLIHPCPGGTYRIDWQVEPGFDLAAARSDGSLDRRIRQVIGDQGYRLLWCSVYRFHARQASTMRTGRVLLAGDFAHLVAPFGARGLNSGVGDADNAAWKLAFVLHGWAGDGLLDSYAQERSSAAAENLAVTSATMDFLVPPDAAAARRRHRLLEAAVDQETAREQVDSGRLAEPFWYVDSPLTLPRPDRPWPGRPARGGAPAMVPGVVVPDGPVTGGGPALRLRELLRRGLTVLARSPGPEVAEVLHRSAPGVPSQVLDVDLADPSGGIADALGMRTGDLWVVRPDAYTSACLTGASPTLSDDLGGAVRRVLGWAPYV